MLTISSSVCSRSSTWTLLGLAHLQHAAADSFRDATAVLQQHTCYFCTRNRTSNSFVLPAREKARQPGDIEAADREMLAAFVELHGGGKQLHDMLDGLWETQKNWKFWTMCAWGRTRWG